MENKIQTSMNSYTKWFKKDNANGEVKPKYNIDLGQGMSFIQSIKGIKIENCEKIMREIIDKGLFFKLCMVAHEGNISEKMKKINSSLSLFKLLIYALKYFKDTYWGLTWGGDLLNDVLGFSKCLVKLSERKYKLSKETYVILFNNFKNSNILEYTSSYDIVLGTHDSLNLIHEIAFEKKRISKPKNDSQDKDFNIYKSNEEKNKYNEILNNLEKFHNNVQKVINRINDLDISLHYSRSKKSNKSKTNSNREIIKGTIKLNSKISQNKSNRSTRTNKSSERSPHDAYYAIDEIYKYMFK
jgi:hypothetical protein